MFRLGTGCPHLLHNPRYDFGDAPLETGIAVMVEAARRYLGAVPEGKPPLRRRTSP
jgi:metal-dependent amidase/aminoacylase/carboxypeptidase family protein